MVIDINLYESASTGKSIYDGWSSWSYWNLCSNSCGQGRRYRYRFCLSLTTSKDKNKACAGRAVMTKPCVLRPCPGKPKTV